MFSAPKEKFYIPYWNALYAEQEAWNNPLISSEDGRYLYVIWLPKGGSMQSLLLDLEGHGGYRFDSIGTPRRVLLYPEGCEISLRHHLTQNQADRLLKSWENDKEEAVRIYSHGFKPFSDLFWLQKE